MKPGHSVTDKYFGVLGAGNREFICAIGGLLLLFLLSCKSGDASCGVADGVRVLDTTMQGTVQYVLVLRTTGVSDKESFLELYASRPDFNSCGKAATEPLSQEHLDLTKHSVKEVMVHDGKLDVKYTSNPAEAVNLKAITFKH